MNPLSMPIPVTPLLRETDARMIQALDNFFQRSRPALLDAIFLSLAEHMTPSALAVGQTCIDRLNIDPESLSSGLSHHFADQLDLSGQPGRSSEMPPHELHLMDDETLMLQVTEDKLVTRLIELLQPETRQLNCRLASIQAKTGVDRAHGYAPRAVVRALSCSLRESGFRHAESNLMLQCVRSPLQETLRHTYVAIDQYLEAQGVEATFDALKPVKRPDRPSSECAAGQSILSHIQTLANYPGNPQTPAALRSSGGLTVSSHPAAAQSGLPMSSGIASGFTPRLDAHLASLQAGLPGLLAQQADRPPQVLRQLQQDIGQTDASQFDRAVLDTVATLFEFIFDDPRVSPRYKSVISHLQVPVFKTAQGSPDFFSNDQHDARRLIDVLGLYSRRFPEHSPMYPEAMRQIESACHVVLDDPEYKVEGFTTASDSLTNWLADEDRRADDRLANEISRLEQFERQEMGTLLALENLRDLTARYPAPESVLRRLEAAWIPFMASLYVAEAGEGPDWRAACATMLQLFLSLQAPEDVAVRESRLQAIPHINAALRQGLLAQGADAEQFKAFFSAITAVQECWVRPELGKLETLTARFVPDSLSAQTIESMSRKLADLPAEDAILLQTEQLLEGDWVDFDPPYDGLETARVAWVGVHGYLLFCDSAGEQRFSLDCDRLADEIRAGRASIPEQSLTRKAMLRLKTQIETTA